MIVDELVRRAVLSARRLDDLVLPEVGGWQYIAEYALTAGAASVTFANIPQVYKTLALISEARTDRAAANFDNVMWQANGDAGNNYDQGFVSGSGGGVFASGGAVGVASGYCTRAEGAASRASVYSPGITFWPGYSRATAEKGSFNQSWNLGPGAAAGTIAMLIFVGHWRNTNAITSLALFPGVGPNLVAGCVFTLYGIF